MNNVIDFPTTDARNTASIEKTISDLLDNNTVDQKAKRELSERLLSIFEIYQQDYSFDFSIDCPLDITHAQAEVIEASVKENAGYFEEQIHSHMDRILLERFHVEIRLYCLESGSSCLQ